MSKVILITGGSSGIGLAVARFLAQDAAAHSIILADLDETNLQRAVVDISQSKNDDTSVNFIVMNINYRPSVEAGVQVVNNSYGRLDVLMNNAGIYRSGLSLSEDLLTHFQTNVVGNAQVTEVFTPLLRNSALGAYVIYTSSGLGSLAESSPGGTFAGDLLGWETIGYRVSKTALNMVVVEDARKLGKHNIKVFAMCPGLVESNIRGTDVEEITAKGRAEKAEVVGPFVSRIIAGERDSDVGKFIRDGGVWPW